MTSVGGFLKQIPSEGRFFMPLSSLVGAIYTVPDGTINNGTPSTAAWAVLTATGGPIAPYSGRQISSINGVGAGRLRDMGQTYVSASRVFRKVQLVVNTTAGTGYLGPALSTGNVSTFGVSGAASTADLSDYFTGFIELGYEGSGPTTPVARTG